MEELPAGLVPVWRGICFEPHTWDGSDVFMPVNARGMKLITHDVKRALETANIKNALYQPLTAAEVFKLD